MWNFEFSRSGCDVENGDLHSRRRCHIFVVDVIVGMSELGIADAIDVKSM
jgi:hypothetical protein